MTGELISGILFSAMVAYVIGFIVQDVVDILKDIHDEEAYEEYCDSKAKRIRARIELEAWFYVGDEVEYNNESAIILGDGLNDTVTIMLNNNEIIDVPVGKIRKVVVL